VYPNVKATQSSLSKRSITWRVHRCSPKTTLNNFWARLVYTQYNFYRVRWRLRYSLYLTTPMYKPFSASKTVQSNQFPNGGFSAKWGSVYKFIHRDPREAHPTTERRFWRILRKNLFRGLGCSELHSFYEKHFFHLIYNFLFRYNFSLKSRSLHPKTIFWLRV